MEPPLVEGIIDKGCYRSIVVRECFGRDVESPHRSCEYPYPYDEKGE